MTLGDPFETPARRVMVFGHPAHELAVFGLLQRQIADIVILTDGGGEDRVAESQRGVEAAGLAARTTYLRFSESSFYDALLAEDLATFEEVARALRDVLGPRLPDQIFCDAVEFYNPVHDITLPIVLRALGHHPPTRALEVPLVYQTVDPQENYAVQRLPESRVESRWRYRLTEAELSAKAHARDDIYSSLRRQLGPEFLSLPTAHLAEEEVGDMADPFAPATSTGRALRYEWRARVLKERGAIAEVITYDGHWLPMARRLAAGSS